MPLTIVIRNDSPQDVLLTVAYLKQAGPQIKITDRDTKRYKYLHTRLGDDTLLDTYQFFPANSAINLTDVISKTEILSFRKNAVHLDVEVTYDARWKLAGEERRKFESVGKFQIVGADRVSRSDGRPAKSTRE